MEKEKITIITAAFADGDALERSNSGRNPSKSNDLRLPAVGSGVPLKVTEVDEGIIEANLATAVRALRRAFSSTFDQEFGDFQLDEVEVALEVTADGRVGFMGSGVGFRGSSTFKLKFGRRPEST